MMKSIATIYDHGCTDCKLHQEAISVCQDGFGDERAKIMVIGRMPNSDAYQDRLEADLAEVGLEPEDLFYSAAIKCRNFEQNASNVDIKACRKYLEAEIKALKPKWILAMGNEALLATTGHSGIMKYRGRVVDREGYSVFPTISPASVQRNPGQRQAYIAELRLFVAQVFDKQAKVPPPKLRFIDSKEKVAQLVKWLDKAELISYDIETKGRDEFDPDGVIVSLAGTLLMPGGKLISWAIPLAHPESKWVRSWRSLLKHLAPHLERIPKQVAHNGKFDARWLRRFGVHMRVTFDTMLAAHILDENRQKGLKPQALSRLGVAPWAISTKDLWSQPIEQVLEYNLLDTYYTYYIYLELKAELLEQERTLRVYQKITMPSNEIYIGAENRGFWMDRGRLVNRTHQTKQMVLEIERQIMEHVPQGTPEELIEQGWPHTKHKVPRPVPVNFNPSNWSRWWLFDYLDLPVLETGKEKADGRVGDPSMREGVMMALKDEHPAIPLLMRRANQVKLAQFMETYAAVLDPNDRIHTSFKLAGTVTGRTSSGKVDEEKISGRATDQRSINLQQVPRDSFVRGLFGAAPGYVVVESDFSQVELRIAAFLARERTMMRLFQMGVDIHAATASTVLGIPASQVTKDHRKKAKPVNFGFLYSMGAPKFVTYAFENYGVHFTLDEAKAVRKAYFAQFSGLLAWHARQKRLAHEYGRVMSPIGRIRRLPDIYSQDEGVMHEAERQAINSPVQSFGSDMLLLAMQLMVAEFKRQGLEAHVIGTVHDAVLLEVKESHVKKVLPIVKRSMEDDLMVALQRKFGVDLDVPIVADLKVGSHWGDAQEVPGDLVFDDRAIKRWLKATDLGRIKEAV